MRRSDLLPFWLVCLVGAFAAACNPRKRRSDETGCLQGKDLFLGLLRPPLADFVTGGAA